MNWFENLIRSIPGILTGTDMRQVAIGQLLQELTMHTETNREYGSSGVQ